MCVCVCVRVCVCVCVCVCVLASIELDVLDYYEEDRLIKVSLKFTMEFYLMTMRYYMIHGSVFYSVNGTLVSLVLLKTLHISSLCRNHNIHNS